MIGEKRLFRSITENTAIFINRCHDDGIINSIKAVFRRISFHADYELYKFRAKFNILNKKKIMNNPFEVVKVPLSAINYKCTSSKVRSYKKQKQLFRNIIYTAGVILDGDWDTYREPIENDSFLKAFRQRFVNKKPWTETLFYDLFHEGKKRRGTISWQEYRKNHLERWEKIYKDIKNIGYMSQKKIPGEYKTYKEILVCVSRDGELMRIPDGGGIHRFAMVKTLGLEEIPVIVNVWHKQYIDKVMENTDKDKITPKTAIQPILENKAKKIASRNEG